MVVRYEVTRDAYLAARRVYRSGWERWRGPVTLVIFGLICLAIAAFALAAPKGRRPGGWWVLPAVFLVSVAAAQVERWWHRERGWRATRALGEITWEFGDAGFTETAGPARTFLEWRAFTHYRETPDLFLLYRGKSDFQYVPKDALDPVPGALDEMRRLLDTHVRLTRYDPRQAVSTGFPVSPREEGASKTS